jgi:Bacterial Ig-like domain
VIHSRLSSSVPFLVLLATFGAQACSPKDPCKKDLSCEDDAAGLGGSPETPPSGEVTLGDGCEDEGEIACDVRQDGQTLVCFEGEWAPNGACGSHEVCKGGRCKAVLEECRGLADGEEFCADQTLFACRDDGLSRTKKAGVECCEDADCSAGEGCMEHHCGDNVPPTVVSITPEPGARGVRSDADIQLTFSEPMDTASVETALVVSGISDENSELTWNEEKTLLTLRSNAPLAYAEGTTTDTPAEMFTVVLSEKAADASGNPLSDKFQSEFSTLRRLSLALDPAEVGYMNTHKWTTAGDEKPAPACYQSVESGAQELLVGRFTSPGCCAGSYSGWVGFDLGAFALSGVASVERAELFGLQLEKQFAYYDAGGTVALSRTNSGSIAQGFELEEVASFGTFADSDTVALSADVREGLIDVWQSIDPRPIFQLAPGGSGDEDLRTSFLCDGFRLEVEVLAE